MANTYTTASKNTANASTEGKLDIDVSKVLWHTGEPTDFPLSTLLGGQLYKDGMSDPQDVKGRIKKSVATEIKYSVVEKDPLSRTVTVNGDVADTTTTTVTLDASARLTIGDTLYNKNTGERMLVYALDSGGAAISVRRNLGSTSYTIGDNDVLQIMGYAAKQGASKRTIQSAIGANRDRYVQIFKRSFGITDTLDNIALKVEKDDWDEEMTQALVEHKRDMEYSAWFNPNADSSTDSGSNTVYLSRGIIAELTAASRAIDCEAMDEAKFFGEICEKIFEFGPQRKTLFADSKLKSLINSWARTKVQMRIKETIFGLNVMELETGHGVLEIVNCGVFSKFLPTNQQGYGVVLDLDQLTFKHIANRDTKLQTGIETPGDDAKEGQYITEAGFSLTLLPHHSILTNAA